MVPRRDATHAAGPLVVLAAGFGRRFGGLKPLAPVGPSGEAIIEYTVWDALHAGFRPVVLGVRSTTRAEIESVLRRHEVPLADVVTVQQDTSPVTPWRRHPWGTTHAVVVGGDVVEDGCAVVNGDDLYGRSPLEVLAGAAVRDPAGDHLVAHRWAATMPHTGRANRGVCEVDEHGWLRTIREVRDLDAGSGLPAATPVSMNVWRFGPATVSALRRAVAAFAQDHLHDDHELTLADAVGALVRDRRSAVRVHPTGASWSGVTYRDDLDDARAGIRDAIAAGRYPPSLPNAWGAAR